MVAIRGAAGDGWLCLATWLHIIGNPHSTVPCVGASGGISGVITYYALRFPRARLGYMFWYWWHVRWVHVPAYVALLFWFALQFLLVAEQQLGVGNVAALAHLGGAAVGVGAWLLWRTGITSSRMLKS